MTEGVPRAGSEAPDYRDPQNRTVHLLRYLATQSGASRTQPPPIPNSTPVAPTQETGYYSAVALCNSSCRQLELGFRQRSLQLVINNTMGSSCAQGRREELRFASDQETKKFGSGTV